MLRMWKGVIETITEFHPTSEGHQGECRLCRQIWNIDQLWVYQTLNGSRRFICSTCQKMVVDARKWGTYARDKKRQGSRASEKE